MRDRNKFHLLVIGDGPQRTQVQKLQSRSFGETFHGFRTALILLISPVIIAQRIFSFIRVFRKHLAL